MCPPAALPHKWFAQRTQVRFHPLFRGALQATKFLDEYPGSVIDRNDLAKLLIEEFSGACLGVKEGELENAGFSLKLKKNIFLSNTSGLVPEIVY